MTTKKTFVRPLVRPRERKPTPAPHVSTDYGDIGAEYRKRFGGPFYPLTRNAKPIPPCDICGAEYLEGKGYERCNGSCMYGG